MTPSIPKLVLRETRTRLTRSGRSGSPLRESRGQETSGRWTRSSDKSGSRENSFSPDPKGFVVATEASESGKFANAVTLLQRNYKGGKIKYRLTGSENLQGMDIIVEHRSRSFTIEDRDKKTAIRKLEDELEFQVGHEKHHYRKLYEKLRDPNFTDDYLKLNQVTADELKDDSAIVLHKLYRATKTVLKVLHRNKEREWSIMVDSIYDSTAVKQMMDHLDYFVANREWVKRIEKKEYADSSDIMDAETIEKWRDILRLVKDYYRGAKVFRKTDGRIWMLRLSNHDEFSIHEEKGQDLKGVTIRLYDWLYNNRYEHRKTTTLHSHSELQLGPYEPPGGEWAKITHRDQHGGSFKKLYDLMKISHPQGQILFREHEERSATEVKCCTTILFIH